MPQTRLLVFKKQPTRRSRAKRPNHAIPSEPRRTGTTRKIAAAQSRSRIRPELPNPTAFTDTDSDAVTDRSALPHRFSASLVHGTVNQRKRRAASTVHHPRRIPRIVLARLKDGTICEGPVPEQAGVTHRTSLKNSPSARTSAHPTKFFPNIADHFAQFPTLVSAMQHGIHSNRPAPSPGLAGLRPTAYS